MNKMRFNNNNNNKKEIKTRKNQTEILELKNTTITTIFNRELHQCTQSNIRKNW